MLCSFKNSRIDPRTPLSKTFIKPGFPISKSLAAKILHNLINKRILPLPGSFYKYFLHSDLKILLRIYLINSEYHILETRIH